MQPMIIATQKGKPASRVFWIPAIVNNARPRVSKRAHVLLNLVNSFFSITKVKRAAPVHIRYIEFVIQKGTCPSITSRIVPPPIAVASPTTYPPNQSKFFEDADRMPEMANAKVPRNSITNCNENIN